MAQEIQQENQHPEKTVKEEGRWKRIEQRIVRVFIGDEKMLKYDGFLRRQIERAGLSQEQLESTVAFIRQAEATHVNTEWIRDKKTHEQEMVETPYKITPVDLLAVIEIAKRCDDITDFSNDLFALVSRTNSFSSTLEILDGVSTLPNASHVMKELNSLGNVRPEGLYTVKKSEDGPGLVQSRYERGKDILGPEPITTIASQTQEEIAQMFSDENKERFRHVVGLLDQKVIKYKDEETYKLDLELVPELLRLFSDPELRDLFIEFIEASYQISDVDKLIHGFFYLRDGLPEIFEAHRSGFAVDRWISSAIGDSALSALVSAGASVEEYRELAEEKLTGLGDLREVLGDERFCANAQALAESGIKVDPSFGTRFDTMSGTTLRSPVFYEYKSTEVVGKLGAFLETGYYKIGFDLEDSSSPSRWDAVFERFYSKLRDVFAEMTPEQIRSRFSVIPDNFFHEVFKIDKVTDRKTEAMSLLRKIVSFYSDDECREWVSEILDSDIVDEIQSQDWVADLGRFDHINEENVHTATADYFFDSPDLSEAIERLRAAAEKSDSLRKLMAELEEQNIIISFKKVENLIRLTEYSDERIERVVSLFTKYSGEKNTRKYFNDESFAFIDTISQYPESTIEKVSAFMDLTNSAYMDMSNLVRMNGEVTPDSVKFMFDNIDTISSGYNNLLVLVPVHLSANSLQKINTQTFRSFAENALIFGENPDLTQTLISLREKFRYVFEMGRSGVANSILELSKDPELIQLAQSLQDEAGYFNFNPNDIDAFRAIKNNPQILKTAKNLHKEARYNFKGSDAEILEEQICSSDESTSEMESFIVELGRIFGGFNFGTDSMLHFQNLENKSEILEFCRDLQKTGYDFSAASLQPISEIAADPELKAFCNELFSSGVEFRFYNLQAYRTLLSKREEVVQFLNSKPENGEILSDNMSHFDSDVPENIESFLEMVRNIQTSQSQDIRALKDQLIKQLKHAEDPDSAWREIESVFIKNHLPLVGKVFKVFEIIYPGERIGEILDSHPNTSSQLRAAGRQRQRYLMFRDLVHTHVRTGNRSLEQYLTTFIDGESVCRKFEESGFESLTPEEQDHLHEFLDRSATLYTNSLLGRVGNKAELTPTGEMEDAFSQEGFATRLSQLKSAVGIDDSDSLFDRLNQMYARPIGKDSLQEMLDEMHEARKEANWRGREIYQNAQRDGGKVEIREGDLLKAVDADYFDLIGQNGSVSQEFLGTSADSDLTPFDTDLSIVPGDDLNVVEGSDKTVFRNAIEKSTSSPGAYGQLLFVIRDRDQFNRTDVDDEDPDLLRFGSSDYKPELFKTGMVAETHYGIRTGFPITEVDYMVFGEEMPDDHKEKVMLEIAKNGYYVPITNMDGEIIFTPSQYEELRRVFVGIDQINTQDVPVDFDALNKKEGLRSELEELTEEIDQNREHLIRQTQVITDLIYEVLAELEIGVFDSRSGSVLGADLDNTGSTSRFTGVIGDSDFDLYLFLDVMDYEKRDQIKTKLLDKLGVKDRASYADDEFTQLVFKDIQYPGLEGADIDLGLMLKSDARTFASHDAAAAKLDNILEVGGKKTQDMVLANIVYAKQYLKDKNAYGAKEGCLPGIALENLILQHDGNILTAFEKFVEAANKSDSFEEFQERFKLYNPGQGARKRKHENYISELSESGYQRTVQVMREFLQG